LEELYFIVSGTAIVAVQLLVLLLLVRVVMSMFVGEEGASSRIYVFCCAVTEPVVAPTRRLLDRVPALQDSPIDFSYLATAFILIMIESALRFF